jgi:hypothetical protein
MALRMVPRIGPVDTTPAAERVWIRHWQGFTPPARLARLERLTGSVIRLSWGNFPPRQAGAPLPLQRREWVAACYSPDLASMLQPAPLVPIRMDTAGVLAPLQPLVTTLTALQVPYYISGGVAAALWAIPRSADDIDLVAQLTPASAALFLARLEPDFYTDRAAATRAVAEHTVFSLVHLPTLFKVDVYHPPPWAPQAMTRAQTIPLRPASPEGLQAATPEDVILQHLVWYRQGGECAERTWLDVRELLQVQAAGLDRGYLQRWAPPLGIADLLAEAETAIRE